MLARTFPRLTSFISSSDWLIVLFLQYSTISTNENENCSTPFNIGILCTVYVFKHRSAHRSIAITSKDCVKQKQRKIVPKMLIKKSSMKIAVDLSSF